MWHYMNVTSRYVGLKHCLHCTSLLHFLCFLRDTGRHCCYCMLSELKSHSSFYPPVAAAKNIKPLLFHSAGVFPVKEQPDILCLDQQLFI